MQCARPEFALAIDASFFRRLHRLGGTLRRPFGSLQERVSTTELILGRVCLLCHFGLRQPHLWITVLRSLRHERGEVHAHQVVVTSICEVDIVVIIDREGAKLGSRGTLTILGPIGAFWLAD